MIEARSPLVWWKGEVMPWEAAQVPVTTLRGVNVYDGARAYWQAESNRFAVISLKGHIERLKSAADLMYIPDEGLIDQMPQGIDDLLKATSLREDFYLRLTLLIDSGLSYLYPDVADPKASQQKLAPTGAFISCLPIGPRSEQPITCIVSTWQRQSDLSLPAIVKTGPAYAAFRLARVEAKQRGADQALLLNAQGMVTESAEASVFLVRQGCLYTPALSEGLLDSLTRRTIISLAQQEFGLKVVECSITRSELYTADEVFICGTWEEVRVVSSIDGHQPRHSDAPISNALRKAYIQMCTGLRSPIDDDFVQYFPSHTPTLLSH